MKSIEMDTSAPESTVREDTGASETSSVPECPHGPMLLFPKYGKNKAVISKIYACSAFRSHKLCPFSMREDSKVSSGRELMLEDSKKSVLPQLDTSMLFKRFKKVWKMPVSKRKYCHTCDVFIFSVEKHTDHEILSNISDELMRNPTKILFPKSDAKKESQYHFTQDTTDTILNIVSHSKKTHVVCLGSPSVHEAIKNIPHLDSILLDIDHRYYNFYGEEEFIWFNMYNGYFFRNENSFKNLSQFLKNKDVMLIIDPPFGAKFPPLAETVKKLERIHLDACESLKYFDVMLISPYFREKEILNVFPMYHMSDYKVNYSNHKQFQSGQGGRKQGSPVRIYTSLDASKVLLPKTEGYWYCKKCSAWRSEDNAHCPLCNDCTSKNGTKYWHCTTCKACVKPSWFHCKECNKCSHPSHRDAHNKSEDRPVSKPGPYEMRAKKRKFSKR